MYSQQSCKTKLQSCKALDGDAASGGTVDLAVVCVVCIYVVHIIVPICVVSNLLSVDLMGVSASLLNIGMKKE